MSNKIEFKIILIYLIVLLLVGVIIFDDYGISWDEPISRSNGFFALEYIYSLLGFDFNFEYPNFFSSQKQSFKEYNDNFYGVIFDLPIGFIEYIFDIQYSRNSYLLRHFSSYIIFLSGSVYFFLTLRKFYNLEISLIGLFFLVFTPRIFAESFYNNKDLLFLSLFCISNYYGISFFEKKTFKNLLKFGIFSGIAVGSRLAGLIIPFLILFFLIIEFKEKDKILFFKKIILYALIIIIFVYIFFPYIWENPFLIFDALRKVSNFDWKGTVFYLGKYEIAKYMPWHYLLITIISTIPLMISLLFIIGSILILFYTFNNFINIKKNDSLIWKNKIQFFSQYNIIIIFSVIFLIIELNSTIYGGWRQIYFIYPSIISLSLFGIKFIYEYINKQKSFIYIIFFFIFFQIFWIVKNHPYQYVYYNFISSVYAQENFELDYWGLSNFDLLKKLDDIKNQNEYKIYVNSASPYENSLLMFKNDIKKKFEFTNNLNEANFIVSNHYYQDINPINEYDKLKKDYNILYEIKVGKIPINTLYEKR